jgi:hypothetical protein
MRLVLLLTGWLPFLLALETAVPTGVHNEPFSEAPPEVRLSPRAQDEIKQVEAHIDNIEAAALAELCLVVSIAHVIRDPAAESR